MKMTREEVALMSAALQKRVGHGLFAACVAIQGDKGTTIVSFTGSHGPTLDPERFAMVLIDCGLKLLRSPTPHDSFDPAAEA